MEIPSDKTLASLFVDRVATDGDRPAIHFKRDGRFQTHTWKQLAYDVHRTAAVLANLGVAPGDRVIQFSENRYEWVVCDLAILLSRAVHVPVHAPLTGEQAAYQIADSGAGVVLLSTSQQAEKIAASAGQIPQQVHYISFEPCDATIGFQKVVPLQHLTSDVEENITKEIERAALAEITPDTLATILYTSGTTGEPKGVMLSQRNLTSNAVATLEMFDQQASDLRLNFLPLSHIFARTCDLYTWIVSGSQLALAESRETVVADCAAISPTLINGVPYFFDKLYRYLCDENKADENGSLRELLGGRIRLCCSGGAALPVHVYDFFQQQGVPVLQGYGLSETSPVITASSPTRNRRGSAGPAIPGVEVRIDDDGEILTRGPHVMIGYYKNQQATEETIRDDWLHTGDLGHLDDEGFLFITGRKKEIIVTSGGKNVAPVLLESLLTEDPLVLQAVVVGDGRNYLTALIVPDPDNLKAEIIAQQIPLTSPAEALTHHEVLSLFQQRIEQRLHGVSHYEQVRKFTLLDRGFTIESGELTPKLSLRRGVIQANFAAEIESMYVKK